MSAPAHTPGPWQISDDERPAGEGHRIGNDGLNICVAVIAHHYYDDFADSEERQEANSALIAQAPAMHAVLALVCKGKAFIRFSCGGTFIELAFQGLRVPVDNGDWNKAVTSHGWDKINAALQEP